MLGDERQSWPADVLWWTNPNRYRNNPAGTILKGVRVPVIFGIEWRRRRRMAAAECVPMTPGNVIWPSEGRPSDATNGL